MKTVFCMAAFAAIMQAQPRLTIGQITGVPGTTVTVDVTLSGATSTAGLQMPFRYSKTITVTVSTPLGNKSVRCNITSAAGALVTQQPCILIGENKDAISNVVVARLSIPLPSTFSGTAGIAMSGQLGASPEGDEVAVAATSGKVVKASSSGLRMQTQAEEADQGFELLSASIHNITCDRIPRRVGGTARCVVKFSVPPKANVGFVPFVSNLGEYLELPSEVYAEAGATSVEFTIRLKERLPDRETSRQRLLVGLRDDDRAAVWAAIEVM